MTVLLVSLSVLALAAAVAPPRPASRLGRSPSVSSLLGAALRWPFSKRPQAAADPLVGRMALIALPLVVIDARLVAPAAFTVWARDVARRRRLAAERSSAIGRELPELIDLFALALAGGGSIHAALALISERPIGPISERLAVAEAAARSGARLADELEAALHDLGPPVRPLLRALAGAEHYGTSIGPTLERLAVEARNARRRDAESRARRVPVRLLGPLVLGVLPAFVLLTVVPTVARTFDGLSTTPMSPTSLPLRETTDPGGSP